MPEDLFLRRTVIGGQSAPNDFVVMWDGISIGRIFLSLGVGGRDIWTWSCFIHNVPQPPRHHGSASTLHEAKASFRHAWEDLQTMLSYDEIKQARAMEFDRSRPWQKPD